MVERTKKEPEIKNYKRTINIKRIKYLPT